MLAQSNTTERIRLNFAFILTKCLVSHPQCVGLSGRAFWRGPHHGRALDGGVSP
jgi:hypothetical protein